MPLGGRNYLGYMGMELQTTPGAARALSPRVQTFVQRLEEAARQTGVETFEDYFFDLIADARGIGWIANRFGVTRSTIYEWLGTSPHLKERLELTRKDAAQRHAEKAGEVYDEVDPEAPTSAQVQLANSKSNWHRWMATVLDRDTFGERPQVAVNLSIGELHLDALRAAAQRRREAPVIEAQVVADGHEDSEGAL